MTLLIALFLIAGLSVSLWLKLGLVIVSVIIWLLHLAVHEVDLARR